jgi:hypothetical protein
MQKSVFHNNKSTEYNLDAKYSHHIQSLDKKKNVSFDKLLNEVKINKKNEFKKKILFCGFGILILSLTGIFLSI